MTFVIEPKLTEVVKSEDQKASISLESHGVAHSRNQSVNIFQ